MTDKIRAALEKHLSALTPALITAWENVSFDPAKDAPNKQPYQRVNLLNANPDDRILGCARRYELGIFQVTLCYPLDKGPKDIETRANLLISHFKRGTVVSHDGQYAQIINTPSKRILGSDGAVFKMAISINYRAEVFG